MTIFILFLVLIVTIVLLTRGSAKVMGKILGKMLNEKHHIAELIVNEGKVPGQWLEGFESKTSNVRNTLVYDEQRLGLEKKAKRRLLRKLDRLIEYFKRSSLFEDRETRMLLHKQA